MKKARPCCVPLCKGEKFPLVHKFPADNDRAEQWRKVLNLSEFIAVPIAIIRKRYFVCSRHFRDSDYKNKASRSINMTAIPSLNLHALTDAEGLTRIIPPAVRPPDAPPVRATELTLAPRPLLDEPLSKPGDELIQIPLSADPLADKADSTKYQLIDFIEETFASKSPPRMPSVDTTPSRVVSKPRGTSLLVPRSPSVQTIELPASSVRRVLAQKHREPVDASHAAEKIRKLSTTVVPTREPIVLQRVKSLPPMAIRKCSTSTAMTQTESEDDRLAADKRIDQDEPQDGEPAGGGGTTKVLALLECTSENLQRLQRKLQEQGGVFSLDERLLRLDDEPDKAGDDNDMSLTKADDSSKFLTIRNSDTQETVRVSYVWLRDHCRCAECYNGTTFQRSYSILDLPVDIEPLSSDINDNQVDVTWSDGHHSSYDLTEVFDNQLEVYRRQLNERRSQLVLWDRDLIENRCSPGTGYARVALNDLLCEDGVMHQIVRSLVVYGFAFITRVPPNQQSTEMAIKRLFPVQKTLFGEMWTFSESKMDHSDTAYTNEFLGPHTDNTYFNDAAGLQVLHCIQFNGTGAETILVDGFRATEKLREADEPAFERLCEYPLEAEYIEEEKHHRYLAPVIKRHCLTRAVEQIRFNPSDRAPLKTLPADMIPQFYQDYQRLAQVLYSKEMQWQFQLTPGTVLIFDNWRVLHGRMAYTGKRVMTGCYVARTEYQSVARTMGLIA
ncbi:uncharacterized protein LOC131205620 [Anopheles bellator]|uniref:uncharacterized protein LOC131205620 n=1 Tax=Anopheles bellator TaxID=139047 RepID=UPI002648ADDF|nr:uncharacterized protein LOC131205620 [Anopheles bellator]